MNLVKVLARKVASQFPERKVIKTIPEFKIELLTSHALDFKVLIGVGHEPKTVAAIKRLVKPGMNAIDVGANIGWIALHLAACVGPTGRVLAFEGSDWTFKRLQDNIRLNDFSWVQPVHAVVGPTDNESVELVLPCGYRLDGADTATKQKMPMVRLDTAAASLQRIDFIKSDTDGYEPGVFEGAREILRRDRPILLFEVAPYYLGSGNEELILLFNELTSLGYLFESVEGKKIDPSSVLGHLDAKEATEFVARAL
jgi:FkbM family methyltransferase